MSVHVVRAYLLADLTSTTASAVYANNTDIFDSASDVPDYAYKSLKDIWVGTSATSAEYSRRIVSTIGEGKTNADGTIEIVASKIEESVLASQSMRSNAVGSECSYIDIRLSLPEKSKSQSTIENAEFRIRYLIDQLWRTQRPSTTPGLDSTSDKSIVGKVLCTFYEYLSPPNALEVVVRYRLEYRRAVPR